MALIFNSLPFKSYKPKVLSSGAASRGRAQGAGVSWQLKVAGVPGRMKLPSLGRHVGLGEEGAEEGSF